MPATGLFKISYLYKTQLRDFTCTRKIFYFPGNVLCTFKNNHMPGELLQGTASKTVTPHWNG